MIKLFGWELRMLSSLGEKRENELWSISKVQILELWNMNANYTIPVMGMLATYAVFVSSPPIDAFFMAEFVKDYDYELQSNR